MRRITAEPAMFPLYRLVYLILIAAGFAAGLYRYARERTIQPVVWLLGLTFCSELLCRILAATVRNNMPVYHVYQPLQLSLWALFFHRNLRSRWRRSVLPLWLALVLFSVVNSAFIQPLSVFPANIAGPESVVLLFWSCGLFREYLELPAQENIFRRSGFIICVAVIWFNLVSYLFFQWFGYFKATPQLLSVWKIHLFSNYTYYSLLLAAMFLCAENPAYEPE